MSFQAVAWAIKQELPVIPKFVLVALCERANPETGECWPGIKTVAKAVCLSERSVVTYIAALVRNGFVERQEMRGQDGRKRTNHYWIQFDRVTAPWIGVNGKIEEIPSPESDEDAPVDALSDPGSDPSADLAHGDHVQADSSGPRAPVCARHIMPEPSGIEPSADTAAIADAIASRPCPQEERAAPPDVPTTFSRSKREREKQRIQQAEEARKAQPIPVIEGSAPWEAWCRHGHPRTLTGKISVNGRLDRGWCFPTLYPPKEDTS